MLKVFLSILGMVQTALRGPVSISLTLPLFALNLAALPANATSFDNVTMAELNTQANQIWLDHKAKYGTAQARRIWIDPTIATPPELQDLANQVYDFLRTAPLDFKKHIVKAVPVAMQPQMLNSLTPAFIHLVQGINLKLSSSLLKKTESGMFSKISQAEKISQLLDATFDKDTTGAFATQNYSLISDTQAYLSSLLLLNSWAQDPERIKIRDQIQTTLLSRLSQGTSNFNSLLDINFVSYRWEKSFYLYSSVHLIEISAAILDKPRIKNRTDYFLKQSGLFSEVRQDYGFWDTAYLGIIQFEPIQGDIMTHYSRAKDQVMTLDINDIVAKTNQWLESNH